MTDPNEPQVCRDCGAAWRPVRRGECSACGSDAGPRTVESSDRAADAILDLADQDRRLREKDPLRAEGGNGRDWRAFTVWVVEPHEWCGAASGAYDLIVLDRDPIDDRERDWLWQVVRPRLKPGGRVVRTLDRAPGVTPS